MNKDQRMLARLEKAIHLLPNLLFDSNDWESLVINRRQPHTYRAFTFFKGMRICLHRFEPCQREDAFAHPHPWPAAFLLLEGEYLMETGYALNLVGEFKPVHTVIMGKGSRYAMTEPLVSHLIQPKKTTYSLMINDAPYHHPHKMAPTTKGKDLETMSPIMLQEHLDKFKGLIRDYLTA